MIGLESGHYSWPTEKEVNNRQEIVWRTLLVQLHSLNMLCLITNVLAAT